MRGVALSGWGLAVSVGLLLWFSQECLAAARETAAVFASGVMPGLFPMMVLAGLPLGRNAVGKRGWRENVEVVLFAFAAGSPAGARRAAVQEGSTAPLFVTAGVMSPLFFLGTLAGWTGSKEMMAILLAIHWLTALASGSVARGVEKHSGNRRQSRHAVPPFPLDCPSPVIAMQPPIQARKGCPGEKTAGHRPISLWRALPQAIASGTQALLMVCGAMMLFAVAAAVLRGLLLQLRFVGKGGGELPMAFLHALLEIGGGAYALLEAGQKGCVPSHILYPLLCAACSFGGLSIWLQNLAYTGQSIRPAALLLYRAVHGALSFGISWAVLQIWPQLASSPALEAGFGPAGGSSDLIPGVPWAGVLSLGAFLLLAAFSWKKSKTCSPHS